MKSIFKPFSSEQGFATIVIIIVAVLALGGIGYVVYSQHNKPASTTTSSSTKSTTASTSVSDSCNATYHDADLCKFDSHSTDFAKTSYTGTISGTQNGVTSSLVFQSDGKGNTSLTSSSGGSTFNSVSVSGATYIESDGSWIKYPSASAPVTDDPSNSINIGVSAAGITYKKLGTEACGSLTCFKYQVTDSASPSQIQTVWFDNKSYLMREWKNDDGAGNISDMKIDYAAVTISAPATFTTFSTGQ